MPHRAAPGSCGRADCSRPTRPEDRKNASRALDSRRLGAREDVGVEEVAMMGPQADRHLQINHLRKQSQAASCFIRRLLKGRPIPGQGRWRGLPTEGQRTAIAPPAIIRYPKFEHSCGQKRGTHLLASPNRHLEEPTKRRVRCAPGRGGVDAFFVSSKFPGFVGDGSRSYAKGMYVVGKRYGWRRVKRLAAARSRRG